MSIDELNNRHINGFASQLKAKQLELKQQLKLSKKNTDPVILDQQSVGRVSRIDAIQQQQMSVASQDQAMLMLKLVNAALQRIESNEYGLCGKCDEPIAIARLQAQPHALYCLACQSAIEQP